MAKSRKETLYIIDGHSHLYRAFHALPESMTSPTGESTNAVFGFTTMLFKLIRERSPDFLAVALDRGKPEERLALFEDYKAHREPMPDSLREQIPKAIRVVEALNIPLCVIEGEEADDVIATLAIAARKTGLDVWIVTGDKDLFQIVDDSIHIYDSQKEKDYDAEAVRERYGIGPERFRDWLALVGDTSDNVPGVPGVGPKSASKLLNEFDSLDDILQHTDRIGPKGLRKKIEDNMDQARLSRDLVTLRTGLDIGVKPADCRLKEPDSQALRKVFAELGFRKMLREIEQPQDLGPKNYSAVTDGKGLDDLVEKLKEANELAVDTETTSLAAHEADLVGISLAATEGEAVYVPVDGVGTHLRLKEVIAKLKPILEDERVSKIGQNLKYDIQVLERSGIELAGISFDTMIASYLLNPTKRGHGMDDLAIEFLGCRKIAFKDVLAKRESLAEVPIEEVTDYACEDADVALRLARRLRPMLEERELMELFRICEMPLVPVLAGMEAAGVRVNADYLSRFGKDLGAQVDGLQRRIWDAAGGEFNISSPVQLSEVLFEKLGLTPGKKTKTGYSTSADVLEKLAEEHEVPLMVLEFRRLSKLKSTYTDALVKAADENQKVHASFNQTVTATGRLSSSEPNLQNIPVRTEEGKRIRQAFVPSEDGMVFLSADYSQIELRFLAHYSGDAAMIDAFSREEDIHRRVAAEVFGVDPEDVEEDMRRRAKAVNFGIVYGQTPYGLSKQIQVPVDEAKAFIDSYFERYPGVKEFTDRTIERARADGQVTTILGRHRPIPEINSRNGALRQMAERTTVNTVIQGSAADLIKLAMIAIWKRLEEGSSARMLVQVHDELLFELPQDTVEKEAAMVEKEMVSCMKLDVPLRVQVKTGKNWAEV